MSESRIARTSLHAELVLLVRDLIIEGTLAAGTKIPEQALCTRFGVSRTPLREALKVLAAEGLVRLTPNRGATVATVSADQVDEVFPVMGMLEALAGELACARMTPAGLKQLQRLHERMVQHYRREAHGDYAKVNRAIHDLIFAIAGNATLTGLYQMLLVRTHSARFTARKAPEDWARAVHDHEELMTALTARDGAAASEILRRHLRHKAQQVHTALAMPASANGLLPDGLAEGAGDGPATTPRARSAARGRTVAG